LFGSSIFKNCFREEKIKKLFDEFVFANPHFWS